MCVIIAIHGILSCKAEKGKAVNNGKRLFDSQ